MTDDSSCDGVAYLLLFSQSVKKHCWRITAEEESSTPSVCQGLFVTLALSCASTYIFHPVKCSDSCRTLPDSVWVPHKADNITMSFLQCGLEHSEKHKDGNDHTRYSESTLTSKNELHTAKCSTMWNKHSWQTCPPLDRLLVSEESHFRAELEEQALHFAGEVGISFKD